MNYKPTPIPFPVRGVSRTTAFSDQPPLTSPDASNVLPSDANTGRMRLSMRPTLAKYLSSQINGSNAIQELASVMKPENRLGTFALHAASASVTSPWQAKLPTGTTVGDNTVGIAVDAQGCQYVAAGDTGVIKLSPDGVEIWYFPIQMVQDAQTLEDLKLDGEGNLYVIVGGSGGATNGYLTKYRILDDGLEHVWDFNCPNGGLFVSLAVDAGGVYLQENVAAPNSYVHRVVNIHTATPTLLWSNSYGQPGTDLCPCPDGCVIASFDLYVTGTLVPMTKKIDPGGGVKWTFQPAGEGGHGFGAVYLNGFVYTVGPSVTGLWGGLTDTKTIRKLRDDGSSVTAISSLLAATATATDYRNNSLAIDAAGNLFRTINAASSNVLQLLATGTLGVTWTLTTSQVDVGEPDRIAVDTYYPGDGTTVEFVYLGGTKRSSDNAALFKLKVGAYGSIAAGTARSLVNLAVSNGTIKKFTTSAASTPTGGASALNTSTQHVSAQTAFGEVFFTDGETYKVYNPVTDAVTSWLADVGRIPPRCKLMGLALGCVILAGNPDNPHEAYLSAVGETRNWDISPIVRTPTQAVKLSDSRAGAVPDAVTAIMTASEDLVYFGCNASIHRLTGHPLANGRFDLVSDRVGVAFGRCWCKDPSNTLYFFGQQGGVYELPPLGYPTRLRGSQDGDDENSIDDLLGAVDLSLNKVRLVWDDALRGLWVFITPFAGGATTHYFWSKSNRSWWPASFPNTFNPLAVLVADGDAPGDRVLLVAGSSGYVHKFDPAGTSDDGTAVSSYVVLGPIMSPGRQTGITGLGATVAVLTSPRTVEYDVYSAPIPDWPTAESVAYSGTFALGRNDGTRDRARGNCLFIKLGRYSAGTAGRWSLDHLDALIGVDGEERA